MKLVLERKRKRKRSGSLAERGFVDQTDGRGFAPEPGALHQSQGLCTRARGFAPEPGALHRSPPSLRAAMPGNPPNRWCQWTEEAGMHNFDMESGGCTRRFEPLERDKVWQIWEGEGSNPGSTSRRKVFLWPFCERQGLKFGAVILSNMENSNIRFARPYHHRLRS